jgi:hypothetical protein
MASQALLLQLIFFTYALVLTDFYGIPASNVGLHLLPFAAGNFLGPHCCLEDCSTRSVVGS